MNRLDEGTAWSLLLRLHALTPAPVDPLRAALGAATLTVGGGGQWRCEPAPDDAARALLELYLPLCVPPGQGCVVAQLGQSLDGRIATPTGHSRYVTGEADRVHLHRLRALADAVVVGPGTVAADDPRLTVRSVPGASPVRVILDPRARLPARTGVFTDGAAPTLLVAPPGARVPAGVEHLPLDEQAPDRVLAALAERGLHRVLVEGGGRTVSAFLAADLLDRLHITVAPVLIGSGRAAVTLPEIGTMAEALRPPVRRFSLGDDVLFDLDLRAGP